MVGLGDQGDPAAGKALDQVDLPHRAVPVQPSGHQPADEFAQLRVAARPGQRGAADMVGDVEVTVVDPDRVREVTGHALDLLPVAGNQSDPGLDQGDELVVVEAGVRWLERDQPPDVHRGRRLLQVEERHVERAEPIRHAGHTSLCVHAIVTRRTSIQPNDLSKIASSSSIVVATSRCRTPIMPTATAALTLGPRSSTNTHSCGVAPSSCAVCR